MEKEEILSFVNSIIKNGVKNHLTADVVIKSINDYANYLRTNNLADEATISIVTKAASNVPELLNLSSKLAQAGLDMPIVTEGQTLNKQPQVVERIREVHHVEQSAPTDCHSGRSMGSRSC